MNQRLNMLRQLLAALIVIAAIGGLSSCEKYSYTPEVVNPTDSVHFQAEIQPIFNANCISCHGAIKAPDLRDGHSYNALTSGGYVDLPGRDKQALYKDDWSGSYYRVQVMLTNRKFSSGSTRELIIIKNKLTR